MSDRDPLEKLPTHEVDNQPPPLGDLDLFAGDMPLREAVGRCDRPWVADYAARLGAEVGREIWFGRGFLANRNPPELVAFDRHGRRLDEVRYHPAYHKLMALAIGHGAQRIAWSHEGEGGHVAHAAALYLLTQPEQGFCCPIVMTHAAVPPLRREPAVAAEWEPRVLADRYDPRCLPAAEKVGATFGMAMTEKQGGSDVRANTTRAESDGDDYRLTGHKWFCSAPMSDAFLTLAQLDAGLTCFLVPRWTPDGHRNRFFIQRLKDKCGNRSHASAEIESARTWARRVGAPGEGVRTIIEMVQQTRLDTATAPVGMMRQALVQALHHARHRRAFRAPLLQQPAMRAVLADLALEVEAGVALVFRAATAVERGAADPEERMLARLATAAAKYWINKRAPQAIYEAMECLGGNGDVEESILPRLYREAPVNSIWEGSGNVICLDVLRALQKTPDAAAAYLREVERGRGGNPHLDKALDRLAAEFGDPHAAAEQRARRITGMMALTLQGSLLVRQAPCAVADAFCAARLGPDAAFVYGALPAEAELAAVLERA